MIIIARIYRPFSLCLASFNAVPVLSMHLILQTTYGRDYYHPHFTNGETEAHRNEGIAYCDTASRWQVFLNCPVNSNCYSAGEIRKAGLLLHFRWEMSATNSSPLWGSVEKWEAKQPWLCPWYGHNYAMESVYWASSVRWKHWGSERLPNLPKTTS